jgi:hypothetical protein
MKSIIPILKVTISTVIALFISSCCTKKDCLDVDSISEIHLLKFSPSETDSITIKTFKKNSNTLIDSFLVKERERTSTDKLIIFMPKNLDLDLDYNIIFSKLTKTFTVTNISTKKITCNTCFPFGNDNVMVLDSYFVNGQKQTNINLEISK